AELDRPLAQISGPLRDRRGHHLWTLRPAASRPTRRWLPPRNLRHQVTDRLGNGQVTAVAWPARDRRQPRPGGLVAGVSPPSRNPPRVLHPLDRRPPQAPRASPSSLERHTAVAPSPPRRVSFSVAAPKGALALISPRPRVPR